MAAPFAGCTGEIECPGPCCRRRTPHECGQELCSHGECWRCGYCETCMETED